MCSVSIDLTPRPLLPLSPCAGIPAKGLAFNYSLLSQDQLESLFTRGVRVVRGADWNYGNQDGGVGGVGTVTSPLNLFGTVGVNWDYNKNRTYAYTMGGFRDLYELALFNGRQTPSQTNLTFTKRKKKDPVLSAK